MKQFVVSSFFLILSSSSLWLVVVDAAKIKIHVKYMEAGKSKDLEGAEVQCWDEDYANGDDRMTKAKKTDSRGRAELYYAKKSKSTLLRPTRGWDNLGSNSNPDIYCRVKKQGIMTFHTRTKSNQNQKKTADFGTVYVFPDRVGRGDAGTYNGCGPSSFPDWVKASADIITGVKNACNNHDVCYENCSETRETCDNEFKAVAYSICEDKHDNYANKKLCKEAVDGMYKLIREVVGQPAWDNSRDACNPPSVELADGSLRQNNNDEE